MQVEAQQILEVGQAVVAAETHVVAEEGQHQGEGHGLGDDREIDPGDPRAEGQPPEDEGQYPRHDQHHEGGEGEIIKTVPVPGKFLPVQEDHEIWQYGVAVNASLADLTHHVHAHDVTAKSEESSVTKAEDSTKSPDQIDAERQQGEGKILAQQADHVCGDVKRRGLRNHEVKNRHRQGGEQKQGQQDLSSPVGEQKGKRPVISHASSLHRPALEGEQPTGAFLNEQDDGDQHQYLGQYGAGLGFQKLVDHP